MTVTQGPDDWKFTVTQAERSYNLTQTQYNRPTTRTELEVTCSKLNEETKTCENKAPLVRSMSVLSSSSGSSRLRSTASIDGDGASEERSSEVSSLLENFSTMSLVLVTVTGGVDKLSGSGTFFKLTCVMRRD